MNPSLKQLFEDIRAGSSSEQNDAVGALVEVLRKNYWRGMDNYAFAFLRPSDPLFSLTLSNVEKQEILEQVCGTIYLEKNASTITASLLWALGNILEWDSFDWLLRFLSKDNQVMNGENFYQALIAFENLLVLGREDKPRLRALLKQYEARRIVCLHSNHNRIGLPELAASVLRQIDQLELET